MRSAVKEKERVKHRDECNEGERGGLFINIDYDHELFPERIQTIMGRAHAVQSR